MKFTLIPRAQVAEVLESEPQPPGGLAAKYLVTLTAEERESTFENYGLTAADRSIIETSAGVRC
jgi:hypothetical protein